MVRREKLRKRIETNPKHVRFEDLDKLLRAYGFEVRPPRHGGSHYFYFRGEHRLTVPYRRPHVMPIYVRQALKVIKRLEEEEGNE